MYRNLFTAWYCLGVLALFLATFLILLPFVGVIRASGSTGVLGLFGLLPIFTGTRFRVFPEEKYDERDISFLQRSIFFGFASGIGALCMTNTFLFFFYWMVSGYDTALSIPLHVFWIPMQCAVVVGFLAFAVLLLLLYYKGEQADTWGRVYE